jgi:hypothetical protein
MNLLFRHLCTAPYVLPLEEDWFIRENAPLDVFSRAIHVLETDSAVATVQLRPLNESAIGRGEQVQSAQDGGALVEYRRICPATGALVSSSLQYSNSACLLRRAALLQAGPAGEALLASELESDFARRVGALEPPSYCAAALGLHRGCNSTFCNAAFDHGGGSRRSPGWANPAISGRR